MLNLCDGDNNSNIINQSISGEIIVSNIIEKFNPEIKNINNGYPILKFQE